MTFNILNRDEDININTGNNFDHSFSGIMFDVESNYNENIPIDRLQIVSISIQGTLGNITVWTSDGSHHNKYEDRQQWNRVYRQTHLSNGDALVRLDLNVPIDLPPPGERRCIYIHTSSHDRHLYYGDEKSQLTYQNSFIKIYPGLGHLNELPFDCTGHWWPWRPHREFSGGMCIRKKEKVWAPLTNKFEYQGAQFLNSVYTFLLCNQRLWLTTGLKLPQDAVHTILEMLHWSDFVEGVDIANSIRNRRRRNAIGWHQGHYTTHVMFHRAEYERRVNGNNNFGNDENDFLF